MLRIIFKIHVFLNFEIWNPHNYLHSFIDPYLKKKKLIFLDFHKNIGFLKSICCVGVFIHTRWPHNTENLSQNIVYKPRFEASKWYWCFYPRCDWCPWWFEKDPSEINHLQGRRNSIISGEALKKKNTQHISFLAYLTIWL